MKVFILSQLFLDDEFPFYINLLHDLGQVFSAAEIVFDH